MRPVGFTVLTACCIISLARGSDALDWREMSVVQRESPGSLARQRPFRVDDLLDIQDVGRYFGGPYAFSANGEQLAFTVVRPKRGLANYKWDYLWGNDGGDVWVQRQPGRTPINITNGMSDGSGWWAPQWSPNSQRLAMLSTRSGNVEIWTWEQALGQPRQLTQRAVALDDPLKQTFNWIDDEHVMYAALPRGEQPLAMKIELQTPTVASKAWPITAKGDKPTASVLESGIPADLSTRSAAELVLLNVRTGAETLISRGPIKDWLASPNGSSVALLRQVSVYQPKIAEPLPFGSADPMTLEVANMEGRPMRLEGPRCDDVLQGSVRWSPNGKEIAFLGYGKTRSQPPVLYRIDLAKHRVSTLNLTGLDAKPIVRESPGVEWTGDGRLIVYAAQVKGDALADVSARRDWWLIEQQRQKSLTAGLVHVPGYLWAGERRQVFVGAAGGQLWSLRPSGSHLENLTEKIHAKGVTLVWPSTSNSGRDQFSARWELYPRLIFAADVGGARETYLLETATGKIEHIELPERGAVLSAFEPGRGTGIFRRADRTGQTLWREILPNNKAEVLSETNTFLRDVAESELRLIEYTSLDGENLRGWLLLPYGYQVGKRYPVLTSVYPGSVYSENRPTFVGVDSNSSLNLQIATARGYAVLLPSMPLLPEGKTDDPMLQLQTGVLPAVNAVVAMGIGDPQRLFLMGQSFGGFATYGLVTQTHRFRAAVSLAGLADLVSLYSEFDARERYTDFPQESLSIQALMESAQIRMGSPPWKDLGRYLRNSPIFSVDRVKTPLMIIQGDVDFVSLEQGEEFFNSLYRQGDRARFVRYWGEGHVISSPANIRDMWHRILAWFDDCGDISREATTGELLFDGPTVRSRAGRIALAPEAFARFDRLSSDAGAKRDH